MQFEEKLFIAGSFVEGNGTFIDVINPTNKEKVASVHVAGSEEVDRAVEAAEKAWPAWANCDPAIRAKALNKLADLIEENSNVLGMAQTIEMGRPITQSIGQDIPAVASMYRYFAGVADKVHGKTSLNVPGFFSMEIRQPYGVTAGIIPWNGPLVMFAWKSAPALAVGNASIIKTSEKSPLSALILASLVKQAGIPDGVLSIISGARETGELLASHMRIRKIAFTGSPSAGRAVAQAAARSNIKSCTLELGGKCPAVVFDDADLNDALFWCQMGFSYNSGQICVASTRLYVQEGIFDEFAKRLQAAVSQYPVGDPTEQASASGPQVDAIQHRRVLEYIDMGKKEGKVLVEGNAGNEKGYYVKPTVFVDIKDDAVVNKEEIFGPVAILHCFSTEEEALKRANDTEYGLSAYVFTKDVSRAIRFATSLEAGVVGVNTTIMTHPDLGFGGWKGSGMGRELGQHAIEAYTQAKTIFIR